MCGRGREGRGGGGGGYYLGPVASGVELSMGS